MASHIKYMIYKYYIVIVLTQSLYCNYNLDEHYQPVFSSAMNSIILRRYLDIAKHIPLYIMAHFS